MPRKEEQPDIGGFAGILKNRQAAVDGETYALEEFAKQSRTKNAEAASAEQAHKEFLKQLAELINNDYSWEDIKNEMPAAIEHRASEYYQIFCAESFKKLSSMNYKFNRMLLDSEAGWKS